MVFVWKAPTESRIQSFETTATREVAKIPLTSGFGSRDESTIMRRVRDLRREAERSVRLRKTWPPSRLTINSISNFGTSFAKFPRKETSKSYKLKTSIVSCSDNKRIFKYMMTCHLFKGLWTNCQPVKTNNLKLVLKLLKAVQLLKVIFFYLEEFSNPVGEADPRPLRSGLSSRVFWFEGSGGEDSVRFEAAFDPRKWDDRNAER